MVEYFSGMISTDNPRHARLRRIVSNAFNPRRVRAIEDSIDQVAKATVDAVADRGSCDFATDVAAPFPLRIICEMMGVSPRRRDRRSSTARTRSCPWETPSTSPRARIPSSRFLEAGATLTAMMEELGEHRLEHPVDDLTSALVNSEVDGDALTHQELASFFVLLVTAGNETTRTAIAHAMWAFTQFPDQRDPVDGGLRGTRDHRRRRDRPVGVAGDLDAPNRRASRPSCPAPRSMPATRSCCSTTPRTATSEVFEDPYRFDVLRDPNPHLGFGAAGPHFCLGAHLARGRSRSCTESCSGGCPTSRRRGEPDKLKSNFVNGIKHLPCEFTPSR